MSYKTLPDNFGTITEVDTTAILYDYIFRNVHEKFYLFSEDGDKKEGATKAQILEINNSI